jgi:DNA-binding response OmpR family regulator
VTARPVAEEQNPDMAQGYTNLPAMNILIVDDDKPLASLISEVLIKHGHRTFVAHDGNGALALCARHSFDLAFIDIFMPGKDGIETILELCPRHPSLKIVAMSGMPRWGNRYLGSAITLGAHHSLEKPFSGQQLLAAVEHAVP